MDAPVIALSNSLPAALEAELSGIATVVRIRSLGDLAAVERDAAVIADAAILTGQSPSGLPLATNVVLVTVGADDLDAWAEAAFLHLPAGVGLRPLRSAVRRALEELTQKRRSADLESRLRQRTQELEAVNRIGVALSTVRDHDVLLEMILSKCREVSRADAGSLYLVDESRDGISLRWKLAQNDSIGVSFEERTLAATRKSLAGTVALTGETLVLDDAYDLPEDAEYEINRSFDVENGYLTRSMVVLPMSSQEGRIIGVLQLINRRREEAPARLTAESVPEWVVPFDPQTVHLLRSLTGQAGVALENNLLYESIERLFEGFVTASVTAIEQRDPTTSGHSFRVAELTCELARVADSLDRGALATVRFSPDQIREIRYASLLHDFGKVGVRENVLVKEKKLYPAQMQLIRARFDSLYREVQLNGEREKNEWLVRNGRDGYEQFAQAVDARVRGELSELEEEFRTVLRSNEPTILPEGSFEVLERISARSLASLDGSAFRLLEPEDVRYLSIRKGNLDPDERREIESHVTHTFGFLSKIPWTRELAGVPEIASAHHEKINGAGYPRGLVGEQIPIQSRMMTVSDIYDALTARDRPYKKAVPRDRALDILRMETTDGLLDPPVVELFIDAKIWERIPSGV